MSAEDDYSSDAEMFYAMVAEHKYIHMYWKLCGFGAGLPFGQMYAAPLSH